MTVDLFEPVGNVVESEFLSYIVHEYDSHCTFVVSLGDSSKSLLASRIPHLKFDSLVEYVDGFDFEIDA